MIGVWILIFAIFILPVILVYFKIIKPKYRLETLGILTLIILLIVLIQGWSLKDLGIRFDNILVSFKPYIFFTLLFIIVIFVVAKIFNRDFVSGWWKRPHFEFLFIPLSLAQELAYRSFLMPLLSLVLDNALAIILLNALLFTFLHAIYYDFKYVALLLFFNGIGFATLYYYYPNFILVFVSHAILNFLAVLYGFLSPGKFKTKQHKIHDLIDKRGKMKEHHVNYLLDLLLVLLVSAAVIYLLYTGFIPRNYLLNSILLILIVTLIITLYQRWNLRSVGLRFDNFLKCLPAHIIFTMFAFVFIVVLADLYNLVPSFSIKTLIDQPLFLFSLISLQFAISFSQAFLFRGFLIKQVNIIWHLKMVSIFFSAIIFTLSHIMFSDFSRFGYILFLIGIGFASVYLYRPNLILSSISHLILNLTAIYYGALSSF